MLIELYSGSKKIKNLRDLPEYPYGFNSKTNCPPVSILTTACNEEKNIANAMQSLLKQNYPSFEVIAVNDRSIDKTGEILTTISKVNSEFKVINITNLPQGWLGKNYALNEASKTATGEILLFTDADVVLHPTAVSRAVNHMVVNKIDHVTVVPEVNMNSFLLNVFSAGFSIFFTMFARPSKVFDKKSKRFAGIGAFNMLRKDVYEKTGGYEKIKMRPDDDMKLGKLVKMNGYIQHILFGKEMVEVEWYTSVKDLINGFNKNSFAGVNYNLMVLMAGTFGQFVFFIFSFIFLFYPSAVVRLLSLASIIVMYSTLVYNFKKYNAEIVYALTIPFSCLFFLFIIWYSSIKTVIQGGINWRGTFYSLKELKRNKV